MHDPQRDASLWLDQSEIDLDAARELTRRFPALACFHAQQAAEKALKAVLYATGDRNVLGHSLADLGRRVAAVSDGYERIRGQVAKLDRFYVPTRYPNGLPPGTAPSDAFDGDDAVTAIDTAAQAIEHARAHLDRLRSD